MTSPVYYIDDNGQLRSAGSWAAPHSSAAFINAIAEEGTKAEAIEWLQRTWNERCALTSHLATLTAERDALLGALDSLADPEGSLACAINAGPELNELQRVYDEVRK